MAEPRLVRRALLLGLLLAGLGAASYALLRAQGPPAGPEPVAYDRVACARCRMLVSDPRFAAQLHAEDGRVLFFDDPGCLLLWREEHPEVSVHAAYFHHVHRDDWIPAEETRFAPLEETTPMGYGLGAVRRGEVPNALEAAAALARVREREPGPGGRR